MYKRSNQKAERIPFFHHLIVQFLVVALITSVVAFSTSHTISTQFPEWLFASDWFQDYWDKRLEKAFDDLQKNVTDHQWTCDEVIESMPQRLASENIVFYFELVPFLDLNDPEHRQYIEDHGASVLHCADGNLISTNYMLGEPLMHLYQVSGMITGTVIACLMLSAYVLHLLHRIKQLYQQILYSRNIDVNQSISLKGKDELALLAKNTEQMRISLLELLNREKELQQKHIQLIATLSHDIRTPLTKLMGYAEILYYQKYTNQEERAHCIKYMIETIQRLKEMTDNLLDCVLVKGQLIHDDRQLVDGPEFLTQMLYECFSDLENAGFVVSLPNLSGSYALNVCIFDFQRICDNLSSNILKYASPKHPILIEVADERQMIQLQISNYKSVVKENAPHHGIGLASVKNLIQKMDGSFEISEDKETFSVYISIPKVNREYHITEPISIRDTDS